MTARVSLLILVTGTFTALWSGDQPERVAAADRPAERHVATRSAFSERRLHLPQIARQASVDPRVTRLAVPGASLPLPEGITDGTYLVTNQWGRTQLQIVDQGDKLRERCILATLPDHYVVEQAGNRWHYIRLEDSVVAHSTTSSSARSQ